MIGQIPPPAHDSPPVDGQDLVLTVRLIPDHIALGRPGECGNCPWALAIKVACVKARIPLAPGMTNVKVFGDSANLYLADGSWYVATMPSSARDFVRRFDHGSVDPGTTITATMHFEIADCGWEYS